MKLVSLLLLLVLSLMPSIRAQEYGFFSVVNATGGPLEISVDGKPFPQPLPANLASGGVGFDPGPHTVRLSQEKHGSLSLTLNLVTESSLIVVAYLEKEKRGEDVTYSLKAEVLNNTTAEENSLHVRAIYFGSEPKLTLKINDQQIALEKGRPETVSKGSFPTFAMGDQVLLQTEVEEKTNWLVVVAEVPEEKFVAVSTFDLIYR